MKKLALFLLTAALVAVSLGLFAQTAKADEGRTCLIGKEGVVFSSAECKDYLITYYWITASRGTAVEYLKAIHTTINITGENFYLAYNDTESAQFYLPLFAFDPAMIDEDCAMPQLWTVRWQPAIPQRLEPGVYHLVATFTLDHPVTDVWQACQPGEPLGRNIYNGNYWVDDSTFTITP